MTRPGLEPTTYRTRGEYTNHYTTDAVQLIRSEGFTATNFDITISPLSQPYSHTFRAALEYIGTPSSYFPVSIPPANGDHVIVPTPLKKKIIKIDVLK